VTEARIDRPEDDPFDIHLRLSAQRALLGAIGPSVRAVAVRYQGQQIVFQALVDPSASEHEREDLEQAATRVIADYPAGWSLELAIVDDFGALPAWPELVYRRRGTK
jgi:hypothetical protein